MTYRNAVAFALKRLWNQRWLALHLALGMFVSVALVTAIQVYADGINTSILHTSLANETGDPQSFDFVFRYIGSWNGPLSKSQYQPADGFLNQQAVPNIGLRGVGATRYLSTANLQLYPGGSDLSPNKRLDRVKLSYLSGVFEHVRLVEGTLPRSSAGAPGAVEVLAALDLANDLNLQVGRTYTLFSPASGAAPAYRQEVRVSGLWTPADAGDDFWALYPPDSFEKKLLTPEDAWWTAVDALPTPVDEAAWRLTVDRGTITSEQVPGLIERIERVQNQVNAILPHTDLESSPASALRQYLINTQALAGSLFSFSAPVLGLTLLFLSLMAGLFVHSQHSEIAVLRSRGAPRAWILVVYLIEWGVLGMAALALGLPSGLFLAGVVGRTASFLDFSNPLSFTPQMSFQALFFGLLTVLLGISFCLLPVWQLGRDTVLSYKQERARARRSPLWQRFYLDAACLLPALYGWYTLRAQGRLSLLGRAVGSADPFQNPLLFLLPALFLLGCGLLALRLLPFLLNVLAALAARLPGVTLPYVLRQLARSGAAYQGVLLLTVCTVGLAVFAASEAASLDQTVRDSIDYSVGADLNLAEGGEYIPDAAGGATVGAAQESGLWNFLPVQDHLHLPGVVAAARVGQYDASLTSGGHSANGQVFGVDRADFAQAAFFRDDFAAEPLNGLLNRLAASPDAVLVDQQTWERFSLHTGDPLALQVTVNGQPFQFSGVAVGVFTRFPTWSPERDGALFVANLDWIFESAGALQPYAVWLRTTPHADPQQIVAGINQMGVAVVTVQDARAQQRQTLQTPGRQGVLGMLSVGFLASAALSTISVVLYVLFSFRERAIQLGVLRAIGMNARQMRRVLAAELAVLVVGGLALGVALGGWVALLYIPYLPVQSGAGVDTLPHISQVAWGAVVQIALLFGGAFGGGVVLLTAALRRMNFYQAIKMGESV
jgi:putative ABC transport system permease protein